MTVSSKIIKLEDIQKQVGGKNPLLGLGGYPCYCMLLLFELSSVMYGS